MISYHTNSRQALAAILVVIVIDSGGSGNRSGMCSGSSNSSLRELVGANERHPEDLRVRKRLGSRPA